ncbi:MAG TPA: lipoyl(octanoyl) transferase LipB [Streptosporangiaceae bacterium]|nr:lipoyl(octanoyl) transferase LipB [Streptosporangiaceae bacterium]
MDGELVIARLSLGRRQVPYGEALVLQRELHERRVRGEIPDTCLLLEHEAVFTAGKRTSPADRPVGDPGAPVIEVDRGGKITWHGPGQLVGYPIVALREPVDVVAYVRATEEIMIRTCADFGVTAERVEGRSGAWIRGTDGSPDRKIGAVGIRVARGVTMHGIALNCENDLSWYDRFIACGIRDATTTTLAAETGHGVPVTEAAGALERHLADILGAGTVRRDDDLAGLRTAAAAR